MAAKIVETVPVLGIDSYEDAKAHYVDWLGFAIDWEWREAAGQPVIMSISREGASFMLDQHAGPSAFSVTLKVDDLEALVAEWDQRRPGAAEIVIEPPYEFPAVRVTDNCGNTLHFHEPFSASVEAARAENRDRMRHHVRELLDAGKPFPTPRQLREAIGPDLGTAIEVLNEFPEYAAAFNARRATDA